MGGRVSSPYKADVPFIKCICPKCKCEHKVQMRWIGGDVTPRIYCEDCKSRVKQLSLGIPEHSCPNGTGD